jgi:hypothetical protein
VIEAIEPAPPPRDDVVEVVLSAALRVRVRDEDENSLLLPVALKEAALDVVWPLLASSW